MVISKELIGYTSLLIAVIQYPPYLRLIILRRVKPHIFTRLIWGITSSVAFYAQYVDKGGPGAWTAGLTTAFCFLTVLLGLRSGDKHITRGDCIALVLALSAIPLWYVTDNPLWSVILVTCIDGAGYYPTFRKCWNRPYDEMIYAFGLGILRWILGICALENYTAVTLMYPVFCVVSDSVLIMLLLWRRTALKQAV